MSYVENTLQSLEQSFGKPRKPINMDMLYRIYKAESSVPSLVLVCAKHIFPTQLPRIRVGVYRKGAPTNAPAWMVPPRVVPRYGTREFEQALFMVGFQASFVQEKSFATLVFAVAHELAHIVLYSVSHTLSADEKAVDLTAMLFGFAEVYAEGKTRVVEKREIKHKQYTGRIGSILDVFDLNQTITTYHSVVGRVGYLTEQEMYRACAMLAYARS